MNERLFAILCLVTRYCSKRSTYNKTSIIIATKQQVQQKILTIVTARNLSILSVGLISHILLNIQFPTFFSQCVFVNTKTSTTQHTYVHVHSIYEYVGALLQHLSLTFTTFTPMSCLKKRISVFYVFFSLAKRTEELM